MTTEAIETSGWYVSREDGSSDGPLSDAEMRSAIGRGRIKPADRVWRDGMGEWVEARRIPNFEEVRRTYHAETERNVRAELERQERRAKVNASSQQSERRTSSSNWGTPPKPVSTSSGWRRTVGKPPAAPSTAPRDQGTGSSWDYDDEKTPAKPFDLENSLEQVTKKVGKIPQAAIIFFALGFFMMPLLPVFWFIAWMIWSKANKR